ncbi:MAG: M48 family metalloprotease, partial [Actinomycetota bacterium]
MTVAVASAVLIVCVAFPYVAGPRIRALGTPRQLVAYSSLSTLGIAAAATGWIGSIAGAGPSEVHSISDAVGRCVGIISESLADPSVHIPRGLALAVSAACATKLILGFVSVRRNSVRMRRLTRDAASVDPSTFGLPRDREVLILQSERSFATSWGVLRRQAVISSGLLAKLRADERRAVYEHEMAHV